MSRRHAVAGLATVAVLATGCGAGLALAGGDDDGGDRRPTSEEVEAAAAAASERLLEEPDVLAASGGSTSALPVEDGSILLRVEVDGGDEDRWLELCDIGVEHVWKGDLPGVEVIAMHLRHDPDEPALSCHELLGGEVGGIYPEQLEERYGPRRSEG